MGYGEKAYPLYNVLRGHTIIWKKEQKMAFIEPKEALLQAPALGIPNAGKPFHLYITEREELAIGVLT